jgi:hypothetical protein
MKIFYFLLSIAISVFAIWYLCAEFLDELVLLIFNPDSHEDLMDYWFPIFVILEIISVSAIAFVFYKKRDRKSSI